MSEIRELVDMVAEMVLEKIDNDLFELVRQKVQDVIGELFDKIDQLEQRIEELEEAIESMKGRPDAKNIPSLREVL
ncbi:MAG: hypothetical protein ACP6IP_10470 [Candidatus Njordarchaeia archaeon]